MNILRNRKLLISAITALVAFISFSLILYQSQSQRPTTFVVFGDSRSDIINSNPSALLRTIVSDITILKPDFVIHLGDMVYSDANSEDAIKQQYRNFLKIFEKIKAPKYYVPGNHDIWNDESRRIYEQTFKKLYYSFTQKGYLFIILDTREENKKYLEDQLAWLEALLKDSGKYRNVFLFSHYPIIQRPELFVHPLDMSHWFRTKLIRLLEQHNIQTVFVSHLHLYNKSTYKNLTQYISGGGGANLAVSEKKGGFHHFLVVTLKNKSVDVKIYKPGELLKNTYAEQKDRLYEYSIKVPKDWHKEVISQSTKLSHVIFKSTENGNTLTIKCWKRERFITPKMLISQLAYPYEKDGNIESKGYLNINGNKGYECTIGQEGLKIKYTAFMKRDNVYLLESLIAQDNYEKYANEFATVLQTLVINCQPYPRIFKDEKKGFSYIVPNNWEFTTITSSPESNRLMINRILGLNENVEKQPQVFLDVRPNKHSLTAKELIQASLARFEAVGIPYRVISQGKVTKGKIPGYFVISDMSDEDAFFQRKIICYNVGNYFFRFIIDSHDKKDDLNLMANIIEKGLAFL